MLSYASRARPTAATPASAESPIARTSFSNDNAPASLHNGADAGAFRRCLLLPKLTLTRCEVGKKLVREILLERKIRLRSTVHNVTPSHLLGA